jgi:ribosomal protein L44E
MLINATKKSQKIPIKYECIKCDYNTSSNKDYKKHLDTQKHYNIINAINAISKSQKIPTKYKCDKCSKEYVHQSSLFRHKKMCNIKEKQIISNDDNEEEINYKEMFSILINQLTEQSAQNKEIQNTFIEQNKELHNTIIELIPKIGNNVINNNTNNTNNVSIQVFLNDTCKDAMSLTDFIDTIQVSIADLLFTKEHGLVKGISNLFLSNLEKIPMIQRPLWCSDKKRKRMFIKENKWIEDMNREKTNAMVNTISKIQMKNITKYIADKPNWMANDRIKDTYIHIVKAATDTMDNKIDKIVDNISDKIHLTEDTREKLIK